MTRRPLLPAVLVFGLFLAAVAGAWAWFHVKPRRFPTSQRLEASRVVVGYAFTNIALEAEVLELLAISTNEVIFGAFIPAASDLSKTAGDRIHVFFANWAARSAREMSVVQHTPDICWASAGAVPLELGQPPQMELALGDGTLRFECRVFEFEGGARELSLWCTLVSGQVFEEPARFAPAPAASAMHAAGGNAIASEVRKHTAARRLAGGQFLNAVRHRVAGTGEKQFVRFSTPVTEDDWSGALAHLRLFAAAWLRLEITRPPTVSRLGRDSGRRSLGNDVAALPAWMRIAQEGPGKIQW